MSRCDASDLLSWGIFGRRVVFQSIAASPVVDEGDHKGSPLRRRFGCFQTRKCARSHPVVCSGLLPGLPGGWPGSQGLRSRRNWSSPQASVLVLGPRLLPSPSPPRVTEEVDSGEGSDAAQSVLQTASFRFPARHASPDRGHGSRLDGWGRRSDCAAFLGSAFRASLAL